MKMWAGVRILWLTAALLVAGFAIQWLPQVELRQDIGREKLSDILPTKLGPYRGRDHDIASTDEMKKAVGELLNYDDAVFRTYQLPDYHVSVYVAWWRLGKMSPRLVAAHTPDVCWPGNGWVRDRHSEGMNSSLIWMMRADNFAVGEYRIFRMQETPEYVVFWHKVGNELLSYKTEYAPPWWAWLDEMRRAGFNLRKEQLFVRISSDKPLQEIWSRPELEPLKQALLRAGLRAPVAGEMSLNTK